MQTLTIILGTYLAIGLFISGFILHKEWRTGEDITLGLLAIAFVRSPTWPLLIYLWLEDRIEKPISEVIIIQGSRSAKFERKLKGEG